MDMSHFLDVQMDDEKSVKEFLAQNAMTHQVIHNTLLENGIIVSSIPMLFERIDDDFLSAHHYEHLAWAQALGINLGTDLANTDPSDQLQMQDWLSQHYDDTVLVAQALGLQVM